MINFIVVFYPREQLHSLLKVYNSYYSDQENLQLSYDQVRICVKMKQKGYKKYKVIVENVLMGAGA